MDAIEQFLTGSRKEQGVDRVLTTVRPFTMAGVQCRQRIDASGVVTTTGKQKGPAPRWSP